MGTSSATATLEAGGFSQHGRDICRLIEVSQHILLLMRLNGLLLSRSLGLHIITVLSNQFHLPFFNQVPHVRPSSDHHFSSLNLNLPITVSPSASNNNRPLATDIS